ncbi:MAG: hypothetical protein FDW93_06095 [Bergeyella sp.]|nr:hypothetical protein [Bergeyella sp.]
MYGLISILYYYCRSRFLVSGIGVLLISCVQKEDYKVPETRFCTMEPAELKKTSIRFVRLSKEGTLFSDDLYVEGYVASSDESGNVYKTLYIQDRTEDPTYGLGIVVDKSGLYADFPQGSKVYLKLKGLSWGKYYGSSRLGVENYKDNGVNSVERLPYARIAEHIVRSCEKRVEIIPKKLKLNELKKSNDNYLGCYVQVDSAEFDEKYLCMRYGSVGVSGSIQINDPTSRVSTKVMKTGNFASFSRKTIPSGNGQFAGILSKYNSVYQFLVIRDSDLKMTGPRLDGKKSPCTPGLMTKKTLAELKSRYYLNPLKIEDDIYVEAVVTANDESKNLYKAIYVADSSSGIKININKINLYQDRRFQIGRILKISLKGLYLYNRNGEIQIGVLNNNRYASIPLEKMFEHFYESEKTFLQPLEPVLRNINSLTVSDVGSYIKIKNLQFIISDLGKMLADKNVLTSRTLTDCNGNEISLTTSGYADFGSKQEPHRAYDTEIPVGKGEFSGILTYYNGSFRLKIMSLRGLNFNQGRCFGN